jgi:2-oxoisovalerate dehydrogenase E2 component (dihydrolipoyl transacylase)
MPQLGETVTEGTIAQWLKKPGDRVEKYEPFVEVSTDKVTAEVPAPVDGIIRELIIKEGETVPTGAAIAIIDEVAVDGAPVAAAASANAEAVRQGADEPVPGFNTAAPVHAAAPAAGRNGAGLHPADMPMRVSPAVRRLAREHHLDLRSLRGTGTGGRITAKDVLAASNLGPSAAMAHALGNGAAAPAPSAPSPRPALAGQTLPLSRARQIIAQRMVESKRNAPHAWTMVEVDVSNLRAWREREKARFLAERGYSLTFLPFFLRAVVESLRAYPLMNAKFTEDGIVVHKEVHIGIAVALDGNLMVPVIRDADSLSVAGLAIAAGRIIERARAGKLGADDLSGGTFTVNNTGANGSVLSAPIINGGQAGIVTMEAVVKRPVVIESGGADAIAVRSMMNVCLSLDHRIIDGAVGSGFLVDLKRRLEAMGPSGEL